MRFRGSGSWGVGFLLLSLACAAQAAPSKLPPRKTLAQGVTSHFMVFVFAEGEKRWVELNLPDPRSTEAFKSGDTCKFELEEWSTRGTVRSNVPSGFARAKFDQCSGAEGRRIVGDAKELAITFLPLGAQGQRGWVKFEGGKGGKGQKTAYVLKESRLGGGLQ